MTLVNDIPTTLEECQLCMHVDHVEKLHVIIMREENMVVEIFMLLKYLSSC